LPGTPEVAGTPDTAGKVAAEETTPLRAIWVWKKACGDPQSSPRDAVAGGIHLISCRNGKVVPSPGFQTAALAEAYPRAAPGLRTPSSSPTNVNLRLTGDGAGTLGVWIPGTAQPPVTVTGLSRLALTAQPGSGWRLIARAAGPYSLAVR
jgi:hypothetical protein